MLNFLKAAWQFVKPVVGATVLPYLAKRAAVKIGDLIFKKGGHSMGDKPALEGLIRKLVEFAKNAAKQNALEILTSATGLIPAITAAKSELDGLSEAEIQEVCKQALDNLIGSETDALIGPKDGALLHIDIGFMGDSGFEVISDILINFLSKPLASGLAKVA